MGKEGGERMAKGRWGRGGGRRGGVRQMSTTGREQRRKRRGKKEEKSEKAKEKPRRPPRRESSPLLLFSKGRQGIGGGRVSEKERSKEGKGMWSGKAG